jgi:purine-binding chemotaxis protein CheW
MLLCQVGSLVCSLPLESVSETMRSLAVAAVLGLPAFVAGVSIVRGTPVPVVDLAKLLGDENGSARSRFVVVKVQARKVALWVGGVLGIRTLDPSSVNALPPLLGSASAEFVEAIGSLDSRLLIVLESAQILPSAVWAKLEGAGKQG